jgi:sugar transferase (PEP-CTERM system associated)
MKGAAQSRKSRVTRVLWLMEMLVVVLSVALASRLRFVHDPDTYAEFARYALARGLLVAVFLTGAMAAFGLYQVHLRHNRIDFVLRLLLSFVLGGAALLVVYYAIPQAYIGRGVLALTLAMSLCGVAILRLAAQGLFQADVLKKRVLVLGAGRSADLINTRLRRSADRRSFVLVGFVPIPGQATVVREDLLVRPQEQGFAETVHRLQVDEIVIAPDERRGALPMQEMLACVQRGVWVNDLSTFFEREAGMLQINVVDPSWLVLSGGFDYSTPRRLSKRFFDLVAAGLLLLVSWPAMLAVALCIWLETGSPILYRQVRVGEGGRHFELVKFRSMRVDAEKDGVARWASRDDDRSTRVGRFIRKTRLDELPQLFSVLRGDMSFVGPRPERPQFVDQLNDEIRYYGVRHCVKPGLTGWAQLRYPYGASVRDAEEKLKFDLFYVKNHGLVLDLMILLQTVEVVLFGRGAR